MPFKLPSQILFASQNQGKFKEIKKLLQTINVEAIYAGDFNLIEPDENSGTFAGNAFIKAKFYGEATNMVALADDAGLCIEALNGAPGVDSAPFALDEQGNKNFPHAFAKIQKMLQEKNIDPLSKPHAYFICNLCLFDPKTNSHINFEGRVDGHLTFPSRGNQGFGYDPIFIKNGMDKTFGEIDPQLKEQISHRSTAFSKMKNY